MGVRRDSPQQPKPADWSRWLASWDRQQERLLPDREERLAAIFDVVEATVAKPAAVLDLACGPGSLSVRLLRRFPEAGVTLVDVDPALLAIARGVLGDDLRARIVPADLVDAGWAASLAAGGFDAVVTANSLHWLDEPTLRRLYGDLASLLRPGGVLCNADPMPDEGIDELLAALGRRAEQTRPPLKEGDLDWEGWWRAAAADPALAPLVAERMRRFGGETHPPEFMPPVTWHARALRAAGFVEAGCVWRHGEAAVVAAVR